MKIILKGCTNDVIEDIIENLGSQTISDVEQRSIYDNDEPIFEIELNTTKCAIYTYPEWIYLVRIDTALVRDMVIADFRFEEVIIK